MGEREFKTGVYFLSTVRSEGGGKRSFSWDGGLVVDANFCEDWKFCKEDGSR